MRKEASAAFAIVLTVALFGGAYYFAVIRPAVENRPPNPDQATWTTLEPGASGEGAGDSGGPAPGGVAPAAAGPAAAGASSASPAGAVVLSRHPGGILKCHHPDTGEYYTNAASCEDADLYNRLSTADPLVTHPAKNTYSGQNYSTPQVDAGNSRTNRPRRQTAAADQPNLRLHGKPPPPGLSPECKFPVGKALETERDLAAADDPYQSKWKDTYCRFRCEARQKRCAVAADYYYFDYSRMCRNTDHAYCPVFAAKSR